MQGYMNPNLTPATRAVGAATAPSTPSSAATPWSAPAPGGPGGGRRGRGEASGDEDPDDSLTRRPRIVSWRRRRMKGPFPGQGWRSGGRGRLGKVDVTKVVGVNLCRWIWLLSRTCIYVPKCIQNKFLICSDGDDARDDYPRRKDYWRRINQTLDITTYEPILYQTCINIFLYLSFDMRFAPWDICLPFNEKTTTDKYIYNLKKMFFRTVFDVRCLVVCIILLSPEMRYWSLTSNMKSVQLLCNSSGINRRDHHHSHIRGKIVLKHNF